MGIMDKVTSLLPRLRSRRSEPPAPTDSGALRDDFDRWLQRLSDEPWGFPAVSERGWVPSADVHEIPSSAIDGSGALASLGGVTFVPGAQAPAVSA